MPTVLTCALLSEDAYASSGRAINGFAPVVIPDAERWTADGTSFFARSYLGPGVGVIAIRGSMEAADWLVEDRQIALGNVPIGQLGSAFSYFNHARPALTGMGATRVIITGHSLGGGLAEAVAARVSRHPVAGVTFNAPGLLGFTRVVADEAIAQRAVAGARAGLGLGAVGAVLGAVAAAVTTPASSTLNLPVRNTGILNVRSAMDGVSLWGVHATEPRTVPNAGAHPIGPLLEALRSHPLGAVTV